MRSLQHKAWALVVVTVAVLTSLVVWFSSQSTAASFSALEHESAEQDGERARQLLLQDLTSLSGHNREYAYWADTVNFLAGENLSYLEDNFTKDNLPTLKASGVLVFDDQGKLAGGIGLTEDVAIGRPDPAVVRAAELLVPQVLADMRSETVVDGFKRVGDALYLMTAAPVRKQAAVGTQPKGAQVMFRRFGSMDRERFSKVLLKPVNLSFDPVALNGPDLGLRVLSESRAEATALVRDLQNQPVAQLVVSMGRSLHRQGRSLVWTSALQVAVAGLVMGIALVLLLDRLMLRRLKRMQGQLAEIGTRGAAPGTPIEEKGQDELSDLARGLNRVLVLSRQVAEEREAHAVQVGLLQTEQTDALRQFVRGIAHDFNNSLAAITGWLRLAMEDLEKDHASQEAVQHAQKATRFAADLMRQLQAYTQQTAPKLQRLSLADLLESARSLFDPKRAAGCKIEVESLTDNTWVQADPTQLQQVLVNLLVNASDAMGGVGTIHLHMNTVEFTDELRPGAVAHLPAGRYVSLSVRDEGKGVAPAHIARLFDPYFTTKTMGRGTGLGLAVTKAIMTNHGGAIAVESKLNVGTTFTLYLPLSSDLVRPVQAAAPVALGSDTERSVLFADDDVLVRQAWSGLLEREGWQVTQANDGEEAWALLQAQGHRWSVVLTDLSMPRLNGHDLAKRISETPHPPPVVLMSGHVGLDEDHAQSAQYFAAVLHKPVDPDELLLALNVACCRVDLLNKARSVDSANGTLSRSLPVAH